MEQLVGALLREAPGLICKNNLKNCNKLECLSVGTLSGQRKTSHGQTLASYNFVQITDVKSFISLGPGPNVMKLFAAVIYGIS